MVVVCWGWPRDDKIVRSSTTTCPLQNTPEGRSVTEYLSVTAIKMDTGARSGVMCCNDYEPLARANGFGLKWVVLIINSTSTTRPPTGTLYSCVGVGILNGIWHYLSSTLQGTLWCTNGLRYRHMYRTLGVCQWLRKSFGPQLFYTYCYNQVRRLRLEKLLYLELSSSSNGFLKPLLDPDDGFTSETAERRFQKWNGKTQTAIYLTNIPQRT
jgi:hypothetical protein